MSITKKSRMSVPALSLAIFLTSTALSGTTCSPALADKTNPDFVPPEITLPYPTPLQPVQTQATGQPVPGQVQQNQAGQPGQGRPGQPGGQVPGMTGGSGQGSLGFQIPSQMSAMVNQASQQATTPGLEGGGMNPFLMKGADRLRQPPGTAIPTKGWSPSSGTPQYPGAPTAGSGAGAPPPVTPGQPYPGAPNPQAQLSTSANLAGQSSNQSNPTVVISTSKGNINIMLFRQYAPQTVTAFLQMIHSGFYNGLTFHRVEPGFVIQGGCPKGDGTGNYFPPGSNQPRFLPLETSPKVSHNAAGVVAMARQPGNPNSASCQFYITLQPQPRLDGQYTVFGGVTSGMDVVRMIQKGDRIVTITPSE